MIQIIATTALVGILITFVLCIVYLHRKEVSYNLKREYINEVMMQLHLDEMRQGSCIYNYIGEDYVAFRHGVFFIRISFYEGKPSRSIPDAVHFLADAIESMNKSITT